MCAGQNGNVLAIAYVFPFLVIWTDLASLSLLLHFGKDFALIHLSLCAGHNGNVLAIVYVFPFLVI